MEGGWLREGGKDRRGEREREREDKGSFAWSLAAAAFPLGLWFAG